MYIGDVGSVAELDAFGAKLTGTNTTVAGSEAPGQGGATVRKALADTPCPVDVLGTPVALMRWQGRPAVLVSDSVTLRVVGLGDCAVLVARPLGG